VRRSLSEAVAESLKETKPAPIETAPAPTPKVAEDPVHTKAAEPPARPAVSAAELWPQLVARVNKERPLIRAWVESGQLVEVAGDVAILAFPPDAGLALESCERPNNRKFLEAQLSDLAGQPLTLRCETRAGLVPEKVVIPEAKAEPPPDPMTAFKDDPLIKKALADFKAEIIPA
jgi:DNA polymerase-3 subunit gamma/tau